MNYYFRYGFCFKVIYANLTLEVICENLTLEVICANLTLDTEQGIEAC
jgi:hypothetical protein